jgi:hypothetical protein
MRPDHDVRRKVIRQWMLLPRDKRQTREQAEAFATRVLQTEAVHRGRDNPHETIMAWLSPRVGR